MITKNEMPDPWVKEEKLLKDIIGARDVTQW